MKRFLSTFLSVLIAAGGIIPNAYAAEEEAAAAPVSDESVYEEPDLPQVVHISGDKLKAMIADYDAEHPEEVGNAADGELSAYAAGGTVSAFAADEDDADGQLADIVSAAQVTPYADTNTYTEYVYIRSAADLLAIDGHDGGYYELAGDIDLKGMEWPGVKLTNAVFDGKGHYIYNLTQTSEQSPGLFDISYSDKEANVYVANVNLSDININITKAAGDTVCVTVLGGAGVTPENCYVSGNISTNVTVKNLLVSIFMNGVNCDTRADINIGGSGTGKNDDWSIFPLVKCAHSGYEGDINITGEHYKTNVAGLYYCTDKSVFYGDIDFNGTVVPNDGTVTVGNRYRIYGLRNCDDCAFKGDIDNRISLSNGYDDCDAYGLYACTDCDFTGDISTYAYGGKDGSPDIVAVSGGKNCTFKGNIECVNSHWNGYMTGLSGGSNNTMTGDIYANANTVGSGYCVQGTSGGQDNMLTGDIVGKGRTLVVPIKYASKNCTFNGNATSDFRLHGIFDGCDNCTINGSLTAVGNQYYDTGCITNGSTNCTINGFISVQNGDIIGVNGGSGNTINGDVITQNGEGCGLNYTTDSYISGLVCEKQGYEPLSVSAASPYMGYFKCSCGQTVVSARDLTGEVHHTTTSSSGYVTEYKYGKVYDMHYSTGTGAATDNGEPLEFPPDQEKFPFTVKLVSVESGEVIPNAKISIDGKEYTTNENGIISVAECETNVMLTVKIDDNIVLVNRNFYPVKNQENVVEVCELAVDVELGEEDSDPGNPPQASFNGKKFSIFDLGASVNLPKVANTQISYDVNRKAYRILFGDLKTNVDLKDKRKFNEFYNGIQGLIQNAKDGIFQNKKLLQFINSPTNGAFGFSGSINTVGYIELQKAGDDVNTNGALLIRCAAKAEKTVPFPAAPLFFVTYSISGTLDAGVTLTMNSTNIYKKFEPAGTVALTATPSVSLGAGLKKFASVEAGFAGTIRGEIKLPFETMKDDFQAKLTGEFFILGSVLGYEGRYAWSLGQYKLYPQDPSVKAASDEVIAFNSDEMTLADRSYLQNTVKDTRDGTIKSNIYPYSQVQMGTVNGRRILVWLDDDPARNDLNRTALYYSVRDKDGVWSEPQQVYDDGTPDYQFSLMTNSSRVYLVWQNAAEQVTADSPDEIAPKIELYMTDMGQYSNKYEWEEPTAVTSGNTDYEYEPKIVEDGKWGTYVLWKQNDKNTAMSGFNTINENIYMLHDNGSQTTAPEKLFDNVTYVYDMDIDRNGNVVCLADTDNDITTPGCTLYLKKAADGEVISFVSDSDITGLTHGANMFFFMDNNILKSIDATGAVTELHSFDCNITNPAVIVNTSDRALAVVYEVPDGFDTTIYCSKLVNGIWSAPLPAVSFDEKIRSWDAVQGSDIEIAAVLSDINITNKYDENSLPENTIIPNEMTETVRLAHAFVKPEEDISAVYISTFDDLKPGAVVNFEIGIQNDTLSSYDRVNLKLTDDSGNELYSGEYYHSIVSGEFTSISQSVTLPDTFTHGKITAEISVNGLEEADTENNIVSETFGGTDLELKLRANSVYRTGCVDVSVQNNGSVTAENAVISIKNEAGEVIATETIAEIPSIDKEKVSISIPEAYSRPNEAVRLYAEVVSNSEDLYEYDNADNIVIEAYVPEDDDDGSFVYGDADADKSITASDSAYLLQKALVSTFELPLETMTDNWMKYVDVDCDGSISASDSAYVLQKALVSTFELPAENK